jgi:hypothetical protein
VGYSVEPQTVFYGRRNFKSIVAQWMGRFSCEHTNFHSQQLFHVMLYGPYILQSEVEKAIKEMRDKKATGYDDVPGDVLKLFGEGGLRLMTQMINSM